MPTTTEDGCCACVIGIVRISGADCYLVGGAMLAEALRAGVDSYLARFVG